MNFGLFYDSGYQHPGCNANTPTDPTRINQPARCMVATTPTRVRLVITMVLCTATRASPSISEWAFTRCLAMCGGDHGAYYLRKQCPTDPDFSWIGQWPAPGYWRTYTDLQSHKKFNVWEGHYDYPGTSTTFVPTWAGGMFEGLMANLVMPETIFGRRSFGLNDLRWAQVQVEYATQALHYPVWGMSPSSTADDSGGYGGFGVEGLLFPYFGGGADASHPNLGLSQCHGCATEDTVSPHASFLALSVLPQEAYANIVNLRNLYPDVYSSDGGFYDAVNPVTGAVGHRPSGARSVHDHGRARQRDHSRSDAAPFRDRPSRSDWIALSCLRKDVDSLARLSQRKKWGRCSHRPML